MSPSQGPHRKARVAADIVCFGMIIPALVFIVDQVPEHNTGRLIEAVAEFISDDAAIVACLLRGWNVRSGLIGTALGNDVRGRKAARTLEKLGVVGQVRLSKQISTPYEVNVSDRTGHRTFFWQRDPRVLETLDTAPLNLLKHAKLLYVDWYDGPYILRAIREANRIGVPVYLNLEHGHTDPELVSLYAARASICQAVTDAAQREGDPATIACKLLDAGVETAIVTMAGGGCIAVQRDQRIRAFAPRVEVVDGCGAGATFSAGVIYGHLHRWGLEETIKFATAAASLKCTTVGPRAFPLSQIKQLAREVQVEPV